MGAGLPKRMYDGAKTCAKPGRPGTHAISRIRKKGHQNSIAYDASVTSRGSVDISPTLAPGYLARPRNRRLRDIRAQPVRIGQPLAVPCRRSIAPLRTRRDRREDP